MYMDVKKRNLSTDKNPGKDQKHPANAGSLTRGQRAADAVTKFCGSWSFIGLFFFIMFVWILLNVLMMKYQWDPYPFILLNFVLSCLAAVQAPIILMSQNRVTERDRITARYDYLVNRKAEREIQNMQRDLDEIKLLIKGICKDTKSKKVVKKVNAKKKPKKR